MPMLGGRLRFESQEAEGSPIDSLFRDNDNQPRRRDTRQILRASVERLKTGATDLLILVSGKTL